jgi:hypothetical protein
VRVNRVLIVGRRSPRQSLARLIRLRSKLTRRPAPGVLPLWIRARRIASLLYSFWGWQRRFLRFLAGSAKMHVDATLVFQSVARLRQVQRWPALDFAQYRSSCQHGPQQGAQASRLSKIYLKPWSKFRGPFLSTVSHLASAPVLTGPLLHYETAV